MSIDVKKISDNQLQNHIKHLVEKTKEFSVALSEEDQKKLFEALLEKTRRDAREINNCFWKYYFKEMENKQ